MSLAIEEDAVCGVTPRKHERDRELWDGCVHAWVGGWTDGWIHGFVNVWMANWVGGQMDGYKDL